MRIFKIILGVLIIVALFAAIFMYAVITSGIIKAILIFATSFVVVLLVILSMKLIIDNIEL